MIDYVCDNVRRLKKASGNFCINDSQHSGHLQYTSYIVRPRIGVLKTDLLYIIIISLCWCVYKKQFTQSIYVSVYPVHRSVEPTSRDAKPSGLLLMSSTALQQYLHECLINLLAPAIVYRVKNITVPNCFRNAPKLDGNKIALFRKVALD